MKTKSEIIAYNVEIKEAIERRHGSLPDQPYCITGQAFQCIECGDWISAKTLEYYKYKVKELKCYECQAKEHLARKAKG